jgi:hypothetical protein
MTHDDFSFDPASAVGRSLQFLADDDVPISALQPQNNETQGATTDAQMTGFSRNPSLFKGLAVPTMKSKERSDVPGPGCLPDPSSLILACFAAGVSIKGDGHERSNISGIAYN